MLDGLIVVGVLALTVFMMVRRVRKHAEKEGCACVGCAFREDCVGVNEERCNH